ncbi:MAG: hypothetical protein JSS63_09810 [Bacteroidetes bacterium]|nr:hypothetical protein [Bacteroidota bacterium]MBX7046764.1 hypothetical protein [Ignavibacteria bacterium]
MKNRQDKENIEENINITMDSLQGMQRAKANPFLYEKVMTRINTQTHSEAPEWDYGKSVKYALAMLLFLALNIATIVQISNDKTTTVKAADETSKQTSSQKESKGYFDDFINDTSYNNF